MQIQKDHKYYVPYPMPGKKLQLHSLLNQDIYLTWYSVLSDKVLNDLLKDDHPDPTTDEV